MASTTTRPGATRAGAQQQRARTGKVAERRPRRLARGLGAVPGRRRLCLARRAARQRRWPRASTACGFEIRAQIIWAKDRLVLGRGALPLAARALLVCGPRGQRPLDRRPQADHALADRRHATRTPSTVHGTQKPVECMRRPIENNSSPGPGGLRAVLRLRHHDHRRRDDRPGLPRHRARRRPMSMSRSSAGRPSPAPRRRSRQQLRRSAL